MERADIPFTEADFVWRTRMNERYGENFVDPDLTIQDWGVTYDELEPYFDKFELLLGTGGKAGNLKGKIQPGGNPFESWRSREYPNPPMKEQYGGVLFRKAAADMGYHPFVQPSSNMTRPYTNPEGCNSTPVTIVDFASVMRANTSQRRHRRR